MQPVQNQENDVLKQILQKYMDQPVKLTVYSSKTRLVRGGALNRIITNAFSKEVCFVSAYRGHAGSHEQLGWARVAGSVHTLLFIRRGSRECVACTGKKVLCWGIVDIVLVRK